MASRKHALQLRLALDRLAAAGAFGERHAPVDFLAAIELSELVRGLCPAREDRLREVVFSMARMFAVAQAGDGGQGKTA